MILHCPSCKQPRDSSGFSQRLVLGHMKRVCLSCRTSADMLTGKMPKSKRNPKLIGAGGKAFRQPEGKQAKFTSDYVRPHGKRGPPQGPVIVPKGIKLQVGPGGLLDARYQVDPATFEGGEFSALGPGRYLEVT